MPSLYFPFTLRLHGYVLSCLSDHNFTGLDLFYRIKDCWKGRDTPRDLLLRPLEHGLPLKIGEWCFDTMFDVDGMSESMPKPYFSGLRDEDLLWFIEDVVEAAKLSGCFPRSKAIKVMAADTRKIDGLYDSDEEDYWSRIKGKGRRRLIKTFSKFCQTSSTSLSKMKKPYAHEIADRILHDRQLCNFIAQTLLDIGFDGAGIDGLENQWVKRESWPTWVRSILRARDRGKCAQCGNDLTAELNGHEHIDHMFPIARGGCNDLVNLQLMCEKCNRSKGVQVMPVNSSVPPYIRRSAKRSGHRKK